MLTSEILVEEQAKEGNMVAECHLGACYYFGRGKKLCDSFSAQPMKDFLMVNLVRDIVTVLGWTDGLDKNY
jgi:hypothetical protein